MATVYFLAMLIVAGAALNAVRPPLTDRPAALRPPWLQAMLTAELAPLVLLGTALVSLLAVASGVNDRPIGVVGLWLAGAAVLLLGWAIVQSARALRAMRDALGGIVDVKRPQYRWGSVVYPDPYRLRPGVYRIEDVPYADGLALDLYRSAGEHGPMPILVHVHGGSWVGGSRRREAQPLIQEMASRGWVVASVDYPLAPDATFPEQVIALHGAIDWLREHAASHGGDASRIVITGGSAGAHLASLVALTDHDSPWDDRPKGDPPIAGAVVFYGVFDLLDRKGIRDFWPIVSEQLIKADPEREPQRFHDGSPIDHVSANAPPFLVVHGTHDSLVPHRESDHFAEALAAVSGSAVAHAPIPGATHGFDTVRSLRTQQVIAGVAAFLEVVAGIRAGTLRP